MDKLYYTLAESTERLKMDAVNLGESGQLLMAYRWPEKSDTQNTFTVITSHTKPGYVPVAFGYITPADFSRVVNATRKGDRAHLLNTFATLEELAISDEIIAPRKSGAHLLMAKLVKSGVKYDATFAGLDDIYVTADAMVKYKTALDTIPAAKGEAVRGITKREVMAAFQDLKWNHDQWGRNLATPPQWLMGCRVARGSRSKKASALWNPVLIAAALYDKGITSSRLNNVFKSLPDWAADWQETSELLL